jgi:ribosomal protein S3
LRLIEKGKKISNINEKAKEDNFIEDSYVNENLDEYYEKIDVKNVEISKEKDSSQI